LLVAECVGKTGYFGRKSPWRRSGSGRYNTFEGGVVTEKAENMLSSPALSYYKNMPEKC